MENKLHPKVLLVLVTIFLSISYTNQLQSSHTRTLLRIKRLLNFPTILSSWNSTTDFCNTDSKASLTVVCYEQTITQLHIVGETKPQQLLPKNFSIDSFFTTLLRIPTLKVLTLVSLGLFGPLPSKISGLSSLEIVNMSSNFLYGKIPQELPLLSNLQALILDNNMFDGHLPDWLDSFPSLTVLNLKQNLFNGSLPDSLSSLTNMRVLSLSHNRFYGSVPDLSRLVNLQVLELDDNSFGPNFPRTYNKLVTCVLRNNKFRSSLPDNMSSYYQLERFDISENAFVGPFQLELFSLPAISYINISSNKLSGMLFENLSCNSILEEVDLSSNLLTGKLPKCLVSNSNDRKFLYGGNCLEDTNQSQSQNQHEQAFCHTEAIAVGIGLNERKKHKGVSKTVLAFGIIGGIFGGISLVALIFMIIIRRGNGKSMMMKNSKTKLISEKSASGKLISDSRYVPKAMKFGTVGLPPYRAFSLEEIVTATNNFDTTSFIGQGSQGQMNRGQLKDGSLVAIRSVKLTKSCRTRDFMQHIELISKFRHHHLVSVLGHCFEHYLDDSNVRRIFIVFEYVPNGSLKTWITEPGRNRFGGSSPPKVSMETFFDIFGGDDPISIEPYRHYRKSLTWTQRIEASIGVAKGIQFLHTEIVPSVYSNNLKITDVLLDQNFVAKISSYNMPLLSNIEKVGQGNIFKSPSFNKSVKSEDKFDIYDFGVILMELILGRTIKSRNVDTLKDLLQSSITSDDEARRSIIDSSIRNACLDQSLKTMMEICVRCLVKEPEERPSIEDVLWNLQFASQVQDAWRGDSLSSDSSPISPLPSQRMNFH